MARPPASGINRPASLRRLGLAAVARRRSSAPLEVLALHAGAGPEPPSPSPAGPLRSSVDRALPDHSSASLRRSYG
ncbi:hypothetical protein NDU88_004557 [Pleurodeles waltl]|uniref:Uncharacterized protein n=1 Tax=Pleurodeles waltl TaxID=8319 RepID=A0AAV7RJ35_PLEWA|nr:hypothetical protein NDU88_004557 [Pleurodeles waltl]